MAMTRMTKTSLTGAADQTGLGMKMMMGTTVMKTARDDVVAPDPGQMTMILGGSVTAGSVSWDTTTPTHLLGQDVGAGSAGGGRRGTHTQTSSRNASSASASVAIKHMMMMMMKMMMGTTMMIRGAAEVAGGRTGVANATVIATSTRFPILTGVRTAIAMMTTM